MSQPPKTQRLLWAHAATTGLDPIEDEILEIYLRLTDMRGEDPAGEEQAWWSGVPRCLSPDAELRLNQPDSLRIHARSGLLTDYQEQRGLTFTSLDSDMLGCLNDVDTAEGAPVEYWLTGYNPRFTAEFLRYHAPMTHARLHFQQMDVGSLEQFTRTAFGFTLRPRPEALRARAKVDAALEQYRTYLAVIDRLRQ